jgi:hypothetical protein
VFISNVAVLAVESCLLADLAAIFTPEMIIAMDDAQLEAIASESQGILMARTDLRKRLEDLWAGKRILDEHACKADAGMPGRLSSAIRD